MRKILLGTLLALAGFSAQAEKPELVGYGVRSCEEYRKAYAGWEKGEETAIAEYLRYEDWLSGFTSGLSLATGENLLQGGELEGAMRRNLLYCVEHTESDFFNATMGLLDFLSKQQ
ncbi:MAG: hypothetical protein KJ558_07680 [Gammaproteobacteria bacterium]|nr:hypothetical protein [Gammaproteobacteria bacterium]MBU1654693.1 hypothetical protein [Gammaproteobacteria bacterium]MBU1961417.1 hypothetical protein [Gammaproteobacteria bacterium]